MGEELDARKRVRDDTYGFGEDDSPEVKRLRDDLLEDLDEDSDLCAASHDLVSFMRSFEEEITASPSQLPPAEGVEVASVSDSVQARPDLGFLFEASDDELGLPPSGETGYHNAKESGRVVPEPSELNELWGFEDQIPSYDSLSFAVGGTESDGGSSGVGEYVALDGLFDHSDMGFGSLDNMWHLETLPAQ